MSVICKINVGHSPINLVSSFPRITLENTNNVNFNSHDLQHLLILINRKLKLNHHFLLMKMLYHVSYSFYSALVLPRASEICWLFE